MLLMKQPVILTVASVPEMRLVLRMTTVGVLAQARIGLDRADEIKLAVDEAVKPFMAAAEAVALEYTFTPAGVRIVVGAKERAPISSNPDEWMVLICVLESMGCTVNVLGGDAPYALELICNA